MTPYKMDDPRYALMLSDKILKGSKPMPDNTTPEAKMNIEIEMITQIIRLLQPLKDGQRRTIMYTVATYFDFHIPEPENK